MPPRMIVGKSGVTPCKHFLLNKLLGREIGVLSRTSKFDTYSVLDLTAGDGQTAVGEFTKSCSPGIVLKHLNWLASKEKSILVKYAAIEKQPQTFASLVENCEAYLGSAWERFDANELSYSARHKDIEVKIVNCNSNEIVLPASLGANGSALFVYNDPNHIEDWCLTRRLLDSAPDFTTSLSTLGCNVSGLKRIDLDRRELWYERVDMVTSCLVQPWHDACLLSVGGADQWAYLITAPEKWRDQITIECLRAAKEIKGRVADPQVAWYKKDHSSFKRIQDYLFLTKKEREVAK